MTTHREDRWVAVPRKRLFDLVSDVERYPEFLPMWKEAHIRDRFRTGYCTDQEVGFGPICKSFATRTVLRPPEVIEITSDDRLFQTFLIRWWFRGKGGSCRVVIDLDWRTRSFLLQRAIDLVLPETARTMIEAFEKRAVDLG